MRKSKEERIIAHGDEILKELHKVYLEGIGIDEYYKLLKEYKKLNKRYEKTIKLSDNMGSGIMEENDSLNDNLQYTIKTARNKLLENVSEHRKTKESFGQYKEKIKKYEEALAESYAQNSKIQNKLNSYIKQYGEINHSFNEELKSTNPSSKTDINPSEYKNMDIKRVVSLELSKGQDRFILSKIKLNNFDDMLETIEENSSIPNFINGTYKYIKNCFNKNGIVFHDKNEVFYIIVTKQDLDVVKNLMSKLNVKRKVFNFTINFSIGMTMFIDGKDTEEIFLRRCTNALIESEKNNKIVVK